MRTEGPSRRSVLAGAAALAFGTALPRFAAAQATTAAGTGPVLLEAGEAQHPELGGSAPLAVFQGAVPGPVLRVKRGAPLALRVRNTLSAPLSLTYQGVRVPSAQDGVPALGGQVIAAGGTADITFTPPDAGSFLYRAFAPGPAQRALVGALIVEETEPLPYAADHALVIQAWSPDPGMKVPLLTVNGAVAPSLECPSGSRVRVRLINASVHFLPVRVVDAPCHVIAVDGQPVDQPFALKGGRAQLTPGGRIDLAVDMSTADPVAVQVESAQLAVPLALLAPTGPDGPGAAGAPAALPSNGLPDKIPLQGATRFEVALGATDADLSALPSLGAVKTGSPLVFAFANPSEAPVAVLLHGMPARVLDGLDDGWKPWWHDAVPVPPKATVRAALLARMPGKWAVIGQRGGDGAIVAACSYEVK